LQPLDLVVGPKISQIKEVVWEDARLPKLEDVSASLGQGRGVVVLIIPEGVAHCGDQGVPFICFCYHLVHRSLHAKVLIEREAQVVEGFNLLEGSDCIRGMGGEMGYDVEGVGVT